MSTKDDPRHTKPLFNVKDRVIVFDSDTWEKTGDVGDNSQFYKPATVIKIRKEIESPKRWLADVIFDEGNRVSKGHFQDCMKPYEPKKPEMDVCVNCGCETEYPKSLPIDQREHYIEGAGQLCSKCF